MDKITNSVVKENIRRNLEEECNKKCIELNKKKIDLLGIAYIMMWVCVVLAVIMLIVLAVKRAAHPFLGALGIGAGVWVIAFIGSIVRNIMLTRQKKQLQREYEARTERAIEAYKAEVERLYQQIKAKRKELVHIVDYAGNIFDTCLAEDQKICKDLEKYISFSYIFTVEKDKVTFRGIPDATPHNYGGKTVYGGYNFYDNHYGDLASDAECEAMARALRNMIYASIQKRYSANHVTLSDSHMDAQVTIKCSMPNPKFVARTRVF